MFQISLKKILFFVITKVKNTAAWTYVVSDVKDQEIVGTFSEKRIAENKIQFNSSEELLFYSPTP